MNVISVPWYGPVGSINNKYLIDSHEIISCASVRQIVFLFNFTDTGAIYMTEQLYL